MYSNVPKLQAKLVPLIKYEVNSFVETFFINFKISLTQGHGRDCLLRFDWKPFLCTV